jgi:hypothetical protein
MMIGKRASSIFGAFGVILLLAACSLGVTRNADGSLSVTTTLSGGDLNTAIQAALSDPLIQSLTVDLHSGYMTVNGSRKRLNSDQIDIMTFRLDLGVSGGLLTATVSNALIDGIPVEADRVALWNERIANQLEQSGQRRANSTLQSVTIDSTGVTLTWRIETRRSQGD